MKNFFAGISLKDKSDAELKRLYRKYLLHRLTSGAHFTQRFQAMDADMAENFIRNRDESSPNLANMLRTLGRFDVGEVNNIHVECFPKVSPGHDFDRMICSLGNTVAP